MWGRLDRVLAWDEAEAGMEPEERCRLEGVRDLLHRHYCGGCSGLAG